MPHLVFLWLFTIGFAEADVCNHAEFTRAIMEVQKLLPQPPCTLNRTRGPLEVILIGENHRSKVAAEIQRVGVRRAARGEIAFLSETSEEGAIPSLAVPGLIASHGGTPRTSTLVGLESSAGITMLLIMNIRDPASDYDDQYSIRLLRKYLPLSPLLQDAVLQAELKSPLDSSSMTKARAQLSANGEIEVPQGWRDYLKRVVTATTVLASTKYAAQLDGGEWPDIKYEFGTAEQQVLHDRLMNLRDREFARTAAESICSFARKFERIVVNVGDEHAPSLRRLLAKDFGDTIAIRYFSPFEKGQAEEALRLLSN